MARAIGTLGTIDTITVGGRVFTDLTNLLILQTSITTTARFGTFRKPAGTAGYTPSGATTYVHGATRVSFDLSGTAAPAKVQLLYGDTDVGFDGAAAPTTPIYQYGGTVGTSAYSMYAFASATSVVIYGALPEAPSQFVVPNGKYPAAYYVSGAGQSAIQSFGYEV